MIGDNLIQYKEFVCDGCGVHYALPVSFVNSRKQDHETFYCPRGCVRYYPKKNEVEELKKKVKEKNDLVDYWIDETDKVEQKSKNLQHRFNGLRGAYAALKNRFIKLSKGVNSGKKKKG